MRSALEAYPNIQVVREVNDGDEAVEATSKLLPTVVLMDVNMNKMDGITATRLIKEKHPEIIVIGLTACPKDYQLYAMRKAGAFEVLSKDNAVYELYGSIQRAVAAIKPIFVLKEDAPSSLLVRPPEVSSPADTSELSSFQNKDQEIQK
jgi:DNA-binding NarL/FixJ family response regulator